MPELLQNPDPVHVCEGEKDSDNLIFHGLTATTNPMGAGKWRPSYNAWLENRDVIILPDNDKPGRDHGERIARSLLGTAKTIKIVDLPGLPPKGDLSDWLNNGGSKEELLTLVEATPLWTGEGGKTESYEVGINLTDLGNARRFVAAHGRDLRYCYPWGKWLFWDGRRWVIDDVGEVNRKAKDTIGLIYKEAASEKDDDRRKALANHALRCESDGKLKAMVELAKSEPGIPIKPDEMDRDPWLLNVANVTVNLLTGDTYPHDKEDLIAKLTPIEYQPEIDCPHWIEHLKRIMGHNQALISFLQRGYGYSLTGVTDERIIMIQHGSGANGKTTTNEVVAMCLGEYAVRTPTETLLVKREGSIPNDLAKLKGARFVFCSEADEGKRLGESMIKDLTGGDTIAARFMRGEWFEFQPTFKIWLATNHKPIVRGTDNAIWDRIRLVPFSVSIPESERIPRREMIARFEEELPGILRWMVKGCLDWQKSGLGTPEEIRRATDGYRAEMDVVGDFISECCEVSKTKTAMAKDLYEAYVKWAEGNGEKPISQRAFGGRLTERGFHRERTTGGRYQWNGIGLY